MSTGLHHEPPITYDSSFDRQTENKLATIKIYDENNNLQGCKIPIFTEEGGLEELLYCEEAFFLIEAQTLPLPEDQYIKAFTRACCPEAKHKWQETTRDKNHELNYSDNINGYAEAFTDSIQEHYCNADDAREIMQACIHSDTCKKPQESNCKEHALCINRLIGYSDKLQGHGPHLSQLSQTTMFLHTFPNLWIEQCGQIHGGITAETSIQKIIEYMSSQERQAKIWNGGKKPGRRPGANANNSNNKKSQGQNLLVLAGFQVTTMMTENKNKNNNNDTAATTANNESFQAHLQRAVDSFISQHGGKAEHSMQSAVTLPPAPLAPDANLALPIGLAGGPLSHYIPIHSSPLCLSHKPSSSSCRPCHYHPRLVFLYLNLLPRVRS
eukprot:jgi/Psemu1/14979/gm1.14979_g